ncbi:MAG: SH3 domain-containing protein [Polyangia bacterium]
MIRITPAAVLAACIACAGCAGKLAGDDGDPTVADGGLGGATLTAGGTGRVTATALNLRDGIGTSAAILASMPCGTQVALLDGPSTTPVAGWWDVRFGASMTGWASGTYLVADAAFLPSMCGGDGGGVPAPGGADRIFALAKIAVGYAAYGRHGSWRDDGASVGSCSGSCPSCTHSGQYGADCSGFVAKVWQVPSASPITLDAHPFSTENFYNDQVYWTQIPRSTIQPADALVHRTSTSGHIALFESGADPFGAVWLYEARGCATGVVHDLRTVDSSYIAIRRN